MPLRKILETCLYVDDLERAARFYGEVLGLPLVGCQEGRHLFFRCGEQMLLIFRPEGSLQGDGPIPTHGARGPGHVAFSVSAPELAEWQSRLDQAQIPVEAVIDWPQGGRSIYFRDPAGNSIELAMPEIWGRPR